MKKGVQNNIKRKILYTTLCCDYNYVNIMWVYVRIKIRKPLLMSENNYFVRLLGYE